MQAKYLQCIVAEVIIFLITSCYVEEAGQSDGTGNGDSIASALASCTVLIEGKAQLCIEYHTGKAELFRNDCKNPTATRNGVRVDAVAVWERKTCDLKGMKSRCAYAAQTEAGKEGSTTVFAERYVYHAEILTECPDKGGVLRKLQ